MILDVKLPAQVSVSPFTDNVCGLKFIPELRKYGGSMLSMLFQIILTTESTQMHKSFKI